MSATTKAKKGLSLLLAIIMLFSMVPTTIFTLGADESLPVMMAFDYRSSGDFHSGQYYNKIYSATFLDEIDPAAVAGADDRWDISAAGDGSVMAWVYLNPEATAAAKNVNRYDLYIGGDGGVAINPNSGCLFYFLSVLEVVDARHLDTTNATTFVGMFENCYNLREVNLTGWNTENVTSMENMFKNCYEIETLDLSSFNTSKVTTLRFAFYLCKKLNYIYAGDGWSLESIAELNDGVFNCCYAKFGVTEAQYEEDVKNGKQYDASASKATYGEGGYLTYKAPEVTAEYKVTYEIEGDVVPETEITIPETATYKEGATVTVADVPTADGYVFSGWLTENNADIKDGEFAIHNDVHFVGSWSKLYEVNYEYIVSGYEVPADAPELPATVPYKAGDFVTVERIPYVDGYVFEGWTLGDDLIGSGESFTMPKNNVTLYGYFRKPVESIVVNDGHNTITIKEGEDGEFIHVLVNGGVETTDGVEFKSNDETIVKVDENGKLTPIKSGETTITVKSKDNEEIQITINVVVEKYKVTYKFEGEIPEEATLPVDDRGYSSNDVVEIAENPTAKGYVFEGWKTENKNVTVDKYGRFSMPDEDVLFVGKWTKIPVNNITVNKNEFELTEGYEDKIIVTVGPEDALDKTVTYTSSDKTVVEVDPDGTIRAVGEGEATITITPNDGSPITETVIVKVNAKTYKVSYAFTNEAPNDKIKAPGEATYKAGTTVKVEGLPEVPDGYKFSGWEPKNNADIIDGEFVINNDVHFEGTWSKIPVNDITVNQNKFELTEGDEDKITVTVGPEDALDKTVTYTSSDKTVVEVDPDGTIRAVGEGEATITITSKDDPSITETVTVKVNAKTYKVTYAFTNEAPNDKIKAPGEATYKAGTTVKVEGLPEVPDGYKFLGWTPENNVDIENGEFVINNDVHFEGTWSKIPVNDITVNQNEFELTEGYEDKITVTVVPEDALDKTVIYTSSDKTVVEVDPDGTIRAVGEGEATITITSKDDPSITETVTVKVNAKTYKVTYAFTNEAPNDKIKAPGEATYKAGTTVKVEGLPEVPDGYIFTGWETKNNADIIDGEFVINNDVHFEGTWSKIPEYTVSYEYKGDDIPEGYKAPNAVVYQEGTAVKVADKPEKDGYIFTGWTTENNVDIENGEFKIYNDVHFVGTWSKIPEYKVTYEYVGEVMPENLPELPVSTTHLANSLVGVEPNAKAEGYIFSGWSPEGATVSGGFFVVKNNVRFVGSWQKIEVEDIEVNKNNVELDIGKTVDIKITVLPETTLDKEVIITSSDETVVKIDEQGKIIAVGDGTAVVTVASKVDPSIKEEIIVTVKKPIVYYNVTYRYEGEVPANAPAVPVKATYAEGTTVDVSADPTLAGYTFSGWTTDDAIVSGGKFVLNNDVEFVGSWTPVPAGSVTTITAPSEIELILGEEAELNAKVNEDAINQKLHYISDNEAVASVDANGKIIANGEGKAYITITADGDPTIYKVVVVYVTAEPENTSEHYMVFGKTEKIGWYMVSVNGGEWIPKGGNSHLVIPHGAEVTIRARDVFGDPFTFYINGKAVTPDENNSVTITVDRYVLVGALGIPVIAPDAEEGLTWIQQIIQSIREFFAKIKSWFTK